MYPFGGKRGTGTNSINAYLPFATRQRVGANSIINYPSLLPPDRGYPESQTKQISIIQYRFDKS